MSTASANPTTFFNDAGLSLVSPNGTVRLLGNSINLSGPVTSSGPFTVPSLTVSGASSLQNVAAQALTATTGAFSGALSTSSSATVAGTLAVQGATNLAAASLTGSLAVAGATGLQGTLTCAAASTLQSLAVVSNTQLQGTLAVGGTSAFTGAASFLNGITFAQNTAVSGYDLTCSNNVTVGNRLRVSSTLPQSVQLVNPSTDTTQSLQVYLDRTAASAACNASWTLSPSGGLVLATNSKPAASITTVDQQISVTANRAGDTFRVYGDGSVSSTTELLLDNRNKGSGQLGRVGCDSNGMYLSPGTASRAVQLTYAGCLMATNGMMVMGGLATDNATVSGNLTAVNATLQSATFGSLNCNSLTASSGSALTLYGGDSPKTVNVPGKFVASSINGASGTAITLTGSDPQSSTVVSGRLQVDTLLANAATALTVVPPTAFQANLTAPSALLAAVQVTAASGNSALTTYDCTSTTAGFKATAGVVTGTGYQVAVNSTPIFNISPSSKLTTFTNAVQLNGPLAVQAPCTLQSSLSVTGSTVFGSSVTPQTDAALNLGSSSLRWNSLYMSGSMALPNATSFTGKLSELTPDSLMLQGQQAINFNGPRGLVIKNASTTASSTADVVFDRTAISNSQVAGIGLTGDSGGLFLSTNNAQRLNIGTGGLVGIGGIAGVSPLTIAASTTTGGFKNNGLYIYNSNTSSSASSPQNAVLTTQVQAQSNTALAYHCFDNTSFSWSMGMRGNDSRLYFAPSNSGPYTGQKLSIDQSGNVGLGGGLLIGDGSVTLPAYGFASDNNNDTGFYHPSEGVIGVAVNGVQAMTWNSDTSISVPGNLSVASNLTTAGLSCNGYLSANQLSVNQNSALTGTLSVGKTSSLTDTVITSATTTTSMLRLVGTTSSQAEASMTFSRSGTNAIVWTQGQGSFGTSDDYCVGGGSGQGACLQIAAGSGFVSMRHSYGTSDRKEKVNVQDCTAGLDFVCATKPVEYSWRKGGDGKRHWGFIAQDVEAIAPEEHGIIGSHGVANSTKSLAYTELIAPMAKAIQELKQQVQELRAQISSPGT